MKVKDVKAAAAKGWKVISESDTQVHTEPLTDGWSVEVVRVYSYRAYRVQWRPSYSLIAPNGLKPIAGYDSAASFASYVAHRFPTLEGTK